MLFISQIHTHRRRTILLVLEGISKTVGAITECNSVLAGYPDWFMQTQNQDDIFGAKRRAVKSVVSTILALRM